MYILDFTNYVNHQYGFDIYKANTIKIKCYTPEEHGIKVMMFCDMRFGNLHWLEKSPDLTTLDFFLWGYSHGII